MKAYLINMHLLVPRSRSSAKVKVKYKGYIPQKMAVSGAFVFHKHILFLLTLSEANPTFSTLGQFKYIYSPSFEKHVLTNLSRFFLLGTTLVLRPNVWTTQNPNFDIRSRELKSRPNDREADTVCHDHGHHTVL